MVNFEQVNAGWVTETLERDNVCFYDVTENLVTFVKTKILILEYLQSGSCIELTERVFVPFFIFFGFPSLFSSGTLLGYSFKKGGNPP